MLVLILFPALIFAQKIDNMASFRNIQDDRYFRFNYDNDYFASTDRNYTQGYSFELAMPSLKSNPVNYLFYKPKESQVKYGLAIEHIGYTPKQYKFTEIQFGDRPFAAAIMLKSFSIATETLRKSRVVSALSVGLIGPGAFGKEMQVAIHEATGNTIPRGWNNQIKNDVVLNYEATYEKQLVRFKNLMAIQALGTGRIGTVFTNASIGANGVVGIINSPFSSMHDKNKFALYFYSQGMLNAIGYDATLQGGLFNDTSPYTIASSDITRITAQHDYGFVLQTRTLYFEYLRSSITREFDTGGPAKWGGIKFGFTF